MVRGRWESLSPRGGLRLPVKETSFGCGSGGGKQSSLEVRPDDGGSRTQRLDGGTRGLVSRPPPRPEREEPRHREP